MLCPQALPKIFCGLDLCLQARSLSCTPTGFSWVSSAEEDSVTLFSRSFSFPLQYVQGKITSRRCSQSYMAFVSIRKQKSSCIRNCGLEEWGAREEEEDSGGAERVSHTHLGVLGGPLGAESQTETTGMIGGVDSKHKQGFIGVLFPVSGCGKVLERGLSPCCCSEPSTMLAL